MSTERVLGRVGGFVTGTPHATFESTFINARSMFDFSYNPFFLGLPEVAVWSDYSISASCSHGTRTGRNQGREIKIDGPKK
jgi:hypothetical protein